MVVDLILWQMVKSSRTLLSLKVAYIFSFISPLRWLLTTAKHFQFSSIEAPLYTPSKHHALPMCSAIYSDTDIDAVTTSVANPEVEQP